MIENAIKRAKYHSFRGLLQHALEINSLKLLVFSASSFANRENLSTKLVYVIHLTDKIWKIN